MIPKPIDKLLEEWGEGVSSLLYHVAASRERFEEAKVVRQLLAAPKRKPTKRRTR